MQQVLHLLIVDPHQSAVLARWHGSRWLLPVVTCAQRVRADGMVLRWAAEYGVKGELVGQWLGRVSPDATDWLMAVSAAGAPVVSEMTWRPLSSLSSAASLLDYQGWAVAVSLERGSPPALPGPFGGFTWLDDVKAWIARFAGSRPDALIPYRITPHEVVLGADTARGRVYFKGLTQDRATEARLTQILGPLAPFSFAPTLAVDKRADGSTWWLTAGCPGEHGHGYEQVARALARVQRRMMASGPVIRELPEIDIDAAVRWACELVDDASCVAVLTESFEHATTASVPESWIPMDLDPTNVLVHDGGVRFVDLDDSFIGPAPLAMAVFAMRCCDRSLYEIYERSWSPPLSSVDWPGFEHVATIVESWLGWQRVMRNTERGEVYGALDLAAQRIRERLVRAIHR